MDKWSALEPLCKAPQDYEPDVLAEAYQEITTDLAFAQTHFDEAPITIYLNDLSLALHVQVYRRHPGRWQQVAHFLAYDVPLSFYENRRSLLISLCVFVLGVVLGVASQQMDPEFARAVMGYYYVEMTLDNIAKGEPMAVYDSMMRTDMFLSITINNVYVSFLCYVAGLLTVFGTGMMLMRNAVMLGCFQTFFVQHNLGWESALAIWLHGTLEISMIVVAGAAGIVLGTGWLFPGTLTRMQAFRESARSSLRMAMATVPILTVAAFIEGFFTRHTEWPDPVRLTVIVASLVFVVWYVVVWPRKLHRGGAHYDWAKRLLHRLMPLWQRLVARKHGLRQANAKRSEAGSIPS